MRYPGGDGRRHPNEPSYFGLVLVLIPTVWLLLSVGAACLDAPVVGLPLAAWVIWSFWRNK
jgi:hypothetical protein